MNEIDRADRRSDALTAGPRHAQRARMTEWRERTGQGGGVLIGMLLAVYSFNWIDRQILAILAPAIKVDLGLSDPQLGLLGGLAFALLYSVAGVPLGLLADRYGRTRIVAASLAVWSLFTAACGLAGSFGALFLARLGVGFGEAGGVAPSYALITDGVPAGRQARAIGIYALGIPLGTAAGALLGGAIAARVDWRSAFVVLGLAGLLLAPIFRMTVREPVRHEEPARAPISSVFGRLARTRSFWLLSLGAAAGSTIGYGMTFWVPSFLVRSFGLELGAASRFLGALYLIGGSAGVALGGLAADRLGAHDKGAFARLPACCFLAALPLLAAGLLARSASMTFLLFLVPQALTLVWLAPLITAVQHLVPRAQRATASACFLLINNLIGLGAGSYLIGLLAAAWSTRFGADSLRYAMLSGLGFYALAAILLLIGAKPLRREWQD